MSEALEDRQLVRAVALAIYQVAAPAGSVGEYASFRNQLSEPEDYEAEARAAIAAVRKFDAERKPK